MRIHRLLAVVLTLCPVAGVATAVAVTPPSADALPSFELATADGPVRLGPAEFGIRRTDRGLEVDDRRMTTALKQLAARFMIPAEPAHYELAGDHVVLKHGRPGWDLAYGKTKEMLIRAVQGAGTDLTLPLKRIEPGPPPDNAVVVNLAQFRLDLYRHTSVLQSFPVGVGALRFPTPPGAYYVKSKAKNPSWRNPGSRWARGMPRSMPPGPRNPLGTRALRLDRGALVIHGTPQPWSIGHRSSHGCVRMRRADIERLYDLVPTGTPVFIVP